MNYPVAAFPNSHRTTAPGAVSKPTPIPVRRTGVELKPDMERVLFRPFVFGDIGRVGRVLGRIGQLSEKQVDFWLEEVWSEFGERHVKLLEFFRRRFDEVKSQTLTDEALSESRQLLIGSYFTQEYALECAALFNPSMVWAPDQSDVPEGSRRFNVSLRATGEGHISSLCFRSGLISPDGTITIDPTAPFVTAPQVLPDTTYEKASFAASMDELNLNDGFPSRVLDNLNDTFTLGELESTIDNVLRRNRAHADVWKPMAKTMISFAKANYEVACDPSSNISENCIFPYSPHETNGIEDARFVEFVDDDGTSQYYATYTAYDGSVTFPQLVHTRDFTRFKISTLNGQAVQNKGMALFPRKVRDHYAMIGRQDGENLYLMYSDDLHFWRTKELLTKPTFPWEFVQIGNCGSPIETDEGWLLLSHGVGPMRKYSIGAYLLDLEDPSRVIGRLTRPLLAPNENEREGYVPNVVYSCGGLIYNQWLVLPYAMADYASSFALVELEPLLRELKRNCSPVCE